MGTLLMLGGKIPWIGRLPGYRFHHLPENPFQDFRGNEVVRVFPDE
ncbi:MAG: hypothetical protein NTZ24_08190 [Deltaproteobacteria bacterium]|nr:hypothetical protein [Deltaproteobacteria bacterium]